MRRIGAVTNASELDAAAGGAPELKAMQVGRHGDGLDDDLGGRNGIARD